MSRLLRVLLAALTVASFPAYQHQTSRTLCHGVSRMTRRGALCMEIDKGQFNEYLSSGNFKDAYQVIRRNPMQTLTKEDARLLLNNIDWLDPAPGDLDKTTQQTIDASVLLYKRLQRQKTLVAFDCVQGEYPENLLEVSNRKIEEVTGLSVTALTPKNRTTYWRLAGVCLCLLELLLGDKVGLDPLVTLIPATVLLLGLDQLRYKGAYFETAYRSLYPEYTKKVVCHEAGHFLVAYLLGVPVRGCVTNAWDAQKYPEIQGQAATLFYDVKMADEVSAQRVTRSSLDRLSVVTMAGVAAEALSFGAAEGGIADERALLGLLSTSISPPWSLPRIQGQARWAVLQAVQLIREHRASYDAATEALMRGAGVGDVVLAIEANLPADLPALQRGQQRTERRRRMEMDALTRYVQKMTSSVGGVMEEPVVDASVADDAAGQGKAETLSTLAPSASDPAPVTLGDLLSLPAPEAQNPQGEGEQAQGHETPEEAVTKFAERMKNLQRAVSSGDLDMSKVVEGGQGPADGRLPKQPPGIWLNGLKSMGQGQGQGMDLGVGDRQGQTQAPRRQEQGQGQGRMGGAGGPSQDAGLSMPAPRAGYEEDLRALAQQEGLLSEEGEYTGVDLAYEEPEAGAETGAGAGAGTDSSPGQLSLSLLSSHRGFQMKLMQRVLVAQGEKEQAIEARVRELEAANASASNGGR
ncbi:hypothetical protein B484DRAFT_449459 [Ochromonadaceae sp. CCMP2298]|nr:hypothetical protein B484DRAFT_449459 [Ochromonadaceae sp. CCMP2298]